MRRLFALDQLSPARLVTLNLLGSLLTIGGFLALNLLSAPSALEIPILLALFLGAIGGIVLSSRTQSRLKNGIENGEWTDEQLAPLRAKANWPIWTPLSMAFFLASLGCMLFGGRAHRGLVWPFLLPAQAISNLQRALISRPPSGTGTSILHSDLRPIHSDHWGER